MTFEINCNKRCWECPRECNMKKMFILLPEEKFNQTIINSLKASMGMYITQGGSYEIAQEHLKKSAVALSIARQEYLKNLKRH